MVDRGGLFVPTTRSVALICAGLRRTDDREVIADALTQVAAMPCSPEGLRLRTKLAEAGGLGAITAALLTSRGDVRLQCKAANALGSLCMSEHVASTFLSNTSSSAVLDRLSDMLRSRSQWAQADAVGCLGWLVGNISSTALREIVVLVTQLMVKHTMAADEVFIQQEREREEQATLGRNRGGKGFGGGGGGSGGGGGRGIRQAWKSEAEGSKEDVARERMDNIRVYSLIFLAKAAHAYPSTMHTMVEAGAIPALLRHLSADSLPRPPSKQPPREEDAGSGVHGAGEVDQMTEQHPSLLLAVRLLHAFSSDPGIRTSLLQAKCLPPLIRIRQRLQALVESVTAADGVEPSPKTPLSPPPSPPPPPDETRTAPASCLADEGGVTGRTARDRHAKAEEACGNEIECGSRVGGVDGEAHQPPPLEAMVSLIIDQLVGRRRTSLIR